MSAHITRRRPLARASVLTLLATVACTDLPHTNPFHPDMPVSITVSGPDTLTTVGELFEITVGIDPAWDDAPLEWEYRTAVMWIGNTTLGRTFRLPAGGWTSDTVQFTVWAGPHRATKVVTLDQRLARVGFLPCPLITCIAFLDEEPLLPPRLVGLTHWDAGNSPMDLTKVPDSVADGIVSRDPSIIEIDYGASGRDLIALVPKAQGSTHLVSTQYGSDSVLVYADWNGASMQMPCPAPMTVDESVQLTATAVSSGGVPLIRPYTVTWTLDNSGTGEGTLTSSGFLTATGPGSLFIVARWQGLLASCLVQVSP